MLTADLIVIGAGPAGMAAAAEAGRAGLSVLVLDEQSQPGGQIYRDVERVVPLRGDLLGADYAAGLPLAQGLAEQGVSHLNGAVSWAIEEGGRVMFTRAGRAEQAEGRRILLATGALERPMPVPGWTLPGVMTVGAAQILLKQSGVVPERAVLAGSGPLIYLTAAQMVRAGVPPLALVETQTRGDALRAARHMGGALRGWRYLLKGLGLMRELKRAGVQRFVGAEALAVMGDDRAEGLRFRRGGRDHEIACETVLLHHGVVPNTQAARSIGVAHRWDAVQQCFSPVLDEWGRTGVEGVLIAGDGAGIGGAKAAEYAGRLAALQVAEDLGAITAHARDEVARHLRGDLRRERAIRPFLDTAYPPYAGAITPEDATLVCRCEEVTAGDIRRFARMGCLGPNQAKAFGRAGMGPCQGRYCGLAVSAILAQETGQSMDETGYYRIRPPLKPVTLGELAAMEEPVTDAAE
ncbi:FAD/NAD(P)-dependent oxidoreductase [Marimonas lutisalis]|uniref:FAD/NAD(P)-dependent oxidoreductase n=1 Tax=Marimonas lutisalis TaxID=2545756 RepID=UPI0010F4D380|nr:NAD(P)/FAD-dependent oxidoreductase [Marimonas lutisalis]